MLIKEPDPELAPEDDITTIKGCIQQLRVMSKYLSNEKKPSPYSVQAISACATSIGGLIRLKREIEKESK